MRDTDLCGIIAASLTPVTADLEIDVTRLAAHVRALLAEGCRFVSTFGTTGEGASFSVRQKLAALDALAAQGVDMGRQVPAVMSPDLDSAVGMYAGLGRLGCRAAIILPPFYYPADTAGIVGFFDALFARASDNAPGVILYNIPKLSRVTFDPVLIRALLERHGDRIVGLKDSTGDRDNAVTLAREFPDLSIFVGNDKVLPYLLAAGGAGLIGGLPNLFARTSVAFYNAPDGAEAKGLEEASARRIESIVANGDLIALKGMVAHYRNDHEWRRVMPPLQPLTSGAAAAMEKAFAATGYTYVPAAA